MAQGIPAGFPGVPGMSLGGPQEVPGGVDLLVWLGATAVARNGSPSLDDVLRGWATSPFLYNVLGRI